MSPNLVLFIFSVFYFSLSPSFSLFYSCSLLDQLGWARPSNLDASRVHTSSRRSHTRRSTDECPNDTSSFLPPYLPRSSTRWLNTGGKRTAIPTSSTSANPPQPLLTQSPSPDREIRETLIWRHSRSSNIRRVHHQSSKIEGKNEFSMPSTLYPPPIHHRPTTLFGRRWPPVM